MSKSQIPLVIEIEPARSQAGRLSLVALIFLAGLLLVPLALEGALCCYGQWCEVLDRPIEVHTPMMDTIVTVLTCGNEWYDDRVGPSVHRALREPKIALPTATIMIVLAIVVLKR